MSAIKYIIIIYYRFRPFLGQHQEITDIIGVKYIFYVVISYAAGACTQHVSTLNIYIILYLEK